MDDRTMQPLQGERGPIRALIDEICERFGPRIAGSDEENATSELLASRLEALGLEVERQSFAVAPRAVHALLFVVGLGPAACFALLLVYPPAALAGVLAVLGILVCRCLLGFDSLAAVLAKRRSRNIVGRLRPTGEVRRVLIFSGHHDSAFRMPLLRSFAGFAAVLILIIVLALSGILLIVLSARGTWSLFAPDGASAMPAWEWVLTAACGIGTLAGAVLVAGLVRSDAVPGANDNLSAVAVAWALARRLADRRPRHTEVRFVSFGSEEVGLWGSRAFVRRFRADLGNARLVNLELLGQRGDLQVVSGELMEGVRHDRELMEEIRRAAETAGVTVRRRFLPAGLTDAASFSGKGLRATTLIRLTDRGYLEHYHSPLDDPRSVREENLAEALAVCLALVDQIDRSGPLR